MDSSHRRTLPLLLVTLLFGVVLSSPLPAQLPVTLTGKVEDAPSTKCDPTATHRIACSDVLLKSAKVDLKSFRGKTILLEGTFSMNASCITVDVLKAEKATYATSMFSFFGYKPGKTVTITTTAPTGSLVAIIVANKPGFYPLGSMGTMLIDPLTAGIFSIDPTILVNIKFVTIPNDPTLIGMVGRFQTAFLTTVPSLSVSFLNPSCATITK